MFGDFLVAGRRLGGLLKLLIAYKLLIKKNVPRKLTSPPKQTPTKVFFTLNCGLIQSRFLLTGGGYEYLPVTVNIFAELFKLTVCFSLYVHLLLCKGKGEASVRSLN